MNGADDWWLMWSGCWSDWGALTWTEGQVFCWTGLVSYHWGSLMSPGLLYMSYIYVCWWWWCLSAHCVSSAAVVSSATETGMTEVEREEEMKGWHMKAEKTSSRKCFCLVRSNMILTGAPLTHIGACNNWLFPFKLFFVFLDDSDKDLESKGVSLIKFIYNKRCWMFLASTFIWDGVKNQLMQMSFTHVEKTFRPAV